MKVYLAHADTCLPDYWSGHHLPHLQIPAHNGMTFAAVRRALESELAMGAVCGSDDNTRLLSSDFIRPEEEARAYVLTRKVYAAIRRDIRPVRKGVRNAFPELEKLSDDWDGETPYAFFVILIEEN